MNKSSVFVLFFLLVPVILNSQLNDQITDFDKIKWEREKIAPGLVWKSSHTFINDSVPQNINILIINLKKRKISLSYNPEKNIILSQQATESGAIAAANAGFFNIRDGGSVTYIRTGGVIVDSDTAKKWTRNTNMTGSFLIDIYGNVSIEGVHPNSWYDSHTEYNDVLVTGPLLLYGNKRMQLPNSSLVVSKHPRSVAGRRGSHKIVFVTLDGRTDQATGMTLKEVTELMQLLRCKDAVNLDGGGSTTMWISGKPFNGVVNMPCDNKKFDHEGERAVSDILIIR